ncbi:unnamed protein product [Didymodactylos carnosus]|uniref:Uncharacterized protein n=1 Tax=Didymodactylos carnosus TaxID=1234261 RepID=A0A813X536_9BILA|nr:unnamed protein product [Didymodactylos carnosus]CAF1588164.1 unnamed protein product [Didymodactylos carnosus]CAF3658038.1 unnamed protein product [Didymodactylos carnosus]CAF4390811.1 unnamed protein product [Didymodactylos carnosus]
MVPHCPVCGPKLSLCCALLSIWGIIQLFLMGIFFYVEAAPLLDDIKLNETLAKQASDDILAKVVKDNYAQAAYNCWIAAFLYVATLVFCASQYMCNRNKMGSNDNLNNYGSSPPLQHDQDE